MGGVGVALCIPVCINFTFISLPGEAKKKKIRQAGPEWDQTAPY